MILNEVENGKIVVTEKGSVGRLVRGVRAPEYHLPVARKEEGKYFHLVHDAQVVVFDSFEDAEKYSSFVRMKNRLTEFFDKQEELNTYFKGYLKQYLPEDHPSYIYGEIEKEFDGVIISYSVSPGCGCCPYEDYGLFVPFEFVGDVQGLKKHREIEAQEQAERDAEEKEEVEKAQQIKQEEYERRTLEKLKEKYE